jgi:glucuronate isomerase
VPTFRPDRYLHADAPGWPQALARLAEVTGEDTTSYTGFITALEARRAYFKQNGATASDHGHIDAACTPLPTDALADVWAALQAGTGTPEQAAAFRGHMLFEMARMASEDGLVMQLHPGVVRNYDPTAFAAFGPDTGHDIPTVGEYTHALRPMLAAFGNSPVFRIVLFTVDDTVWTREVGPLAGYFPAVYAGAPWWFLDTPDTIARYRAGITDSAGFYKTSGFIDDTRAYCSIPVRHDMARRLDAAFLARLVSEGRLGADEALDTAVDLAHGLPKQVFRL